MAKPKHFNELAKRYPQIEWNGIEAGLLEPGFGALMARRAVQTLVAEFVKAGGDFRVSAVAPPLLPASPGVAMPGIRTVSGESLSAERYVFACGPWLPKLFPPLLGERIFPTRQEVFFFAPEPGDVLVGGGKECDVQVAALGSPGPQGRARGQPARSAVSTVQPIVRRLRARYARAEIVYTVARARGKKRARAKISLERGGGKCPHSPRIDLLVDSPSRWLSADVDQAETATPIPTPLPIAA